MVSKNGIKLKIVQFVLEIMQEIIKNEEPCTTRDTMIFAYFSFFNYTNPLIFHPLV